MKKLGFFCLLFILALTACRDNIDEVGTTEVPFEPPIVNWDPQTRPVDGSVTGFVVDEAGVPVAGAVAKMGTLSTTTDEYGHFFFNDVVLNARGTVINIEKTGYFDGSRRFSAVADQTNRVKIELITKSFDYAFDASAGGEVQTTDGASITFSPNSIKKADGTIYNGNVRVAAKWLDPSDVQTLDRMPGNLQGVDLESNEVALQTYGMMAVELESDAGEALNISENNTATLSMPVPTGLQGSAPAEIPLWSFNEEYGVWVEESVATLSGGVYTGEVSHFSFWNCDYPGELIEFTATIVDESGDGLGNYRVTISVNTGNGNVAAAGGYSCPDGSVAGLIPANLELTITVYGICGQVIYEAVIGPFNDDVDLGSLGVGAGALNQTTVSGELRDCDNELVENGLVIFEFDNRSVFEYVTNGVFDFTIGTCDNSTDVSVTGVDMDDLVQSDPITVAANGVHGIGIVSVCGVQLQNYITMTVDDGTNAQTVVYAPVVAYSDSTATGGFGTSFYFYDNNQPNGGANIFFQALGDTAGDYSGPSGNFVEVISDSNNNFEFQGGSFDSFIISEYGGFGQPIIGTFEWSTTNYGVQPPAAVTITGGFNVIRQ
ncbi:MAG: carboxypeptidase-like regulatory domain-containing protein [Bacteroidota bacterium]